MAVLPDKVVVVVAHSPDPTGISVSVIIPVLNDAAELHGTLHRLFQNLKNQPGVEVIVCDGGSQDASLEIASQFACQTLTGDAGRSAQMNAGSKLATGNWLLFLHADSILPPNWFNQINQGNSQQWGFFPVKLSGQNRAFRMIETAINYRSQFSRVATGDQALFFRAPFFQSLNGFPEIPIMEDIAISKLARRRSAPLISDSPVITSSRRWEKNGILKTILLMWWLRLAYWSGINPQRLHRYYYPQHSG